TRRSPIGASARRTAASATTSTRWPPGRDPLAFVGSPRVAEDAHHPGVALPADGRQLRSDRRTHLELLEGVEWLPPRIAERLVVLAHGERAASNGPRVDGVDDVATPGLGVDRLADEQETSDLDVVPGLLEQLSRGR